MKAHPVRKPNLNKTQPAASREMRPGVETIASAASISQHTAVVQKKTLGIFTKRETPAVTGMPAETLQMMRYKNIKTGFSFFIQDNGKYISAMALQEPKASSVFQKAPPRHHGDLRYSTTKDSLVIEHIENVPEEGSGLGPLLIQLAAEKAAKLGKPKISVVGLRYPDYYARWGFDIETPREHVRKKYREAGREDEIPKQIGVPQADSTPATIISKTSPWVTKTWVDEWAETAKTASDKTTLTEFPKIED